MKYTKTNCFLQVQLQKAKRRCVGRFNRKLKDLDKKKEMEREGERRHEAEQVQVI